MWITAWLYLTDLEGREECYEVGADVTHVPGGNGWAPSCEVGEPVFSAPNSTLDCSRLAHDPQGGEVFPTGWSDAVEEALAEAYFSHVPDYDD